MKPSIYGKGKDYMSYSAYALWKNSPDAYRRHYYDGEKPFETVETRFGSQIANWLQSDDPRTKHIPNYLSREYDVDVVIEGIKVKGRIDGFDETRVRFLDHKSSHASKEGKAPWDIVKVHKLKQLPFYSMILKEKFGRVDRVCHLVWIETKFKDNTIQFAGHTLSSPSRELILTGKVKKFRRVIKKYEREYIRKDLLLVANEIKLDYENYTKRS